MEVIAFPSMKIRDCIAFLRVLVAAIILLILGAVAITKEPAQNG